VQPDVRRDDLQDMVAGQENALLAVVEAEVPGGVAGDPQRLEAVAASREDLAAVQLAVWLEEDVAAVTALVGGGRLKQIVNVRLGIPLPGEPRDELLTISITAIWVADEARLLGVADDACAGSVSHPASLAAVVAVTVAQDQRVQGIVGDTQPVELPAERLDALGDIRSTVEQQITVSITDEVAVCAAQRVAVDRKGQPPQLRRDLLSFERLSRHAGQTPSTSGFMLARPLTLPRRSEPCAPGRP
jgi:hypothetical protein